MKNLLLSLFILALLYDAEASPRHKKEKWYEDTPTIRHHHRNAKKISTDVAKALANGVAKDIGENSKKHRDKNYSNP